MRMKHLGAMMTAFALLCGGAALAQAPAVPAAPSVPAVPATPSLPATPAVPGARLTTAPTTGAAVSAATAGMSGTAAKPALGKISINNASASELDALPGIGDKRAAAIIKGRPYKTTDELVSKKILSQGVYSKIKDHLTL